MWIWFINVSSIFPWKTLFYPLRNDFFKKFFFCKTNQVNPSILISFKFYFMESNRHVQDRVETFHYVYHVTLVVAWVWYPQEEDSHANSKDFWNHKRLLGELWSWLDEILHPATESRRRLFSRNFPCNFFFNLTSLSFYWLMYVQVWTFNSKLISTKWRYFCTW